MQEEQVSTHLFNCADSERDSMSWSLFRLSNKAHMTVDTAREFVDYERLVFHLPV